MTTALVIFSYTRSFTNYQIMFNTMRQAVHFQRTDKTMKKYKQKQKPIVQFDIKKNED